MGLSKEQIEKMRRSLQEESGPKKDEAAAAESDQLPSKTSTFKRILNIMEWGLYSVIGGVLLVVLFANAKSMYQAYTKLPEPELRYVEHLDEVWEEALTWCNALEETRPDTNWIQREDARIYYSNGEKIMACGPLKKRVERLKGMHYSWDKLSEEQQVEYRRPAWEEFDRPKILERVAEFKAKVPCDINLEAMPGYREDELYSNDMDRIKAWYEKEEKRLHECIKGSIWDGETVATNFMDSLFYDVTKAAEPKAQSQFYKLYSSDKKIQNAYQGLVNEWRIAQSEKYAENSKKWNRYVEKEIKPARKKGRYWEKKWAREDAEKAAEQAFREKHGVGPNDRCSFTERSGRKRTMLCSDAVKTSGWNDLGDGGFSATMRALGDIARAMERERIERQQAEAAAWAAMVLHSEEAEEGETMAASDPQKPSVNIKKHKVPETCRVAPNIAPFKPCLFVTKCTPKPPFKTCSKRDWAKEKACHAQAKKERRAKSEAKYVEYSKSSNCQSEARSLRDSLDGVKRQRSPSKVKTK